MMRKTLVIMAAGIGSRFGQGIKQLAKFGTSGELIMDYSIRDAMEAGFNHVVFVIRRQLAEEFKEIIGDRVAGIVDVDYASQEISDVPAPYDERFAQRTKPWGTGQAILACRDLVDGPFLVINADDYYGREAYVKAADMLERVGGGEETGLTVGMISFILGKTLSDNGSVTRGICALNPDGSLNSICETKDIVKTEEGAGAQTGEGITPLDMNAPVSMNMWVFPQSFMGVLKERFDQFLADLDPEDLKSEYLLPILIGQMLEEGSVTVQVETSQDQWFGMTYQEDVPAVKEALRGMVDAGVYPESLY